MLYSQVFPVMVTMPGVVGAIFERQIWSEIAQRVYIKEDIDN